MTGDRLQVVLAPAEALGRIDGVTVAVVSVELWTSRLIVRLAGLPSALTAELTAAHEEEMARWSPQPCARRRQQAPRARGHARLLRDERPAADAEQ